MTAIGGHVGSGSRALALWRTCRGKSASTRTPNNHHNFRNLFFFLGCKEALQPPGGPAPHPRRSQSRSVLPRISEHWNGTRYTQCWTPTNFQCRSYKGAVRLNAHCSVGQLHQYCCQAQHRMIKANPNKPVSLYLFLSFVRAMGRPMRTLPGIHAQPLHHSLLTDDYHEYLAGCASLHPTFGCQLNFCPNLYHTPCGGTSITRWLELKVQAHARRVHVVLKRAAKRARR